MYINFKEHTYIKVYLINIGKTTISPSQKIYEPNKEPNYM